jgi:hypothetical protein
MRIIKNNEQVKNILLKHCYQKSVFKIVYTSVFCLERVQMFEFDELVVLLIQ